MITWAALAGQGATKIDGRAFESSDFLPYHKLQIEPEDLERMRIEREEAELLTYLQSVSGHKAHRYLEAA